MAYYIDICSPATYQKMLTSDRTITGFKKEKQTAVDKIAIGDKLVLYITGLSRWAGVLTVLDNYEENHEPRFTETADPYVLRFPVRADVLLPFDQCVPIKEDGCWKRLSFTRDLPQGRGGWTGMVRTPLNRLTDEDGMFLEERLSIQQQEHSIFPYSAKEVALLQRQ